MTIVLNHTIVAVADRHRAARLLAGLLGVPTGAPAGPFVPVHVNADLTLDFDDRFGAHPAHYAFLVDDAVFDAALAYAARTGLDWSSTPQQIDHDINHLNNGRGVYVLDPDGIAYELFTTVP
jgi:catechol 2,3-dioxygenase-like lactoylglutathione lyase family enzyme